MNDSKEDIEISELERLWGEDEPWVLINQKSRNESIILNPKQLFSLNQKVQKIIASNTMEEGSWTLNIENWPEFKNPDDRFRTTEALALLISSEHIIPLAAKTQPDSNGNQEFVTGLFVNCSDVFYPAADAQPLPLIGFSKKDEDLFWDLYHLTRQYDWLGVVKWVCLQRNDLPMLSIKNQLKKTNWCDRLQSIEDSQEK